MAKQRVGIVFGGKSAEHEVSLQSAKNILEAIDKSKYEVVLLGIDKQGEWHLNDASGFLLNADNPALIALNRSGENVALVPGSASQQLITRQQAQPLSQLDVIFPIVHGTLGEDGSLQGLLRMANLPFVGSDVLGSAVSMDKDFTKRLLRDAGLNVASWISVTQAQRARLDPHALVEQFGLPLFIKPANQGSSVGVSKVDHIDDLAAALDLAFSFDRKVLIEQGIKGREIECAVLGNDEPEASPCGEVVVHDAFTVRHQIHQRRRCTSGGARRHQRASQRSNSGRGDSRVPGAGVLRYGARRCVPDRERRDRGERGEYPAGLYQYQHVSEVVAGGRIKL